MNFAKKISSFPPVVCRLLARKGPKGRQRPMTEDEIAEDSGLPVATVLSLSWLTSWDDVRCSQMLAFSKACGVDFSDAIIMRKHVKYLNLRSRFCYLRRDPEWHSKYGKMLDIYRAYLKEKYAQQSSHS
jgi:hypothetical protein